MRIAVLSDIHGNLPALEAVLADLKEQSPDQVWCGGDIGWVGPWAGECIARVRETGWPIIKGNTDVWITGDPQTVESEDGRTWVKEVAEQHGISDDDAKWLLNLPLGHNAPGSILLVHGTPNSPFDAPMPTAPSSQFAPYEAQAQIVVYAHVHRAFVRRLADGTLVTNTGSVGLPMDSEQASYLILDRVGPDFVLTHRRVTFDRAAALDRAREVGGALGDSFAKAFGSA